MSELPQDIVALIEAALLPLNRAELLLVQAEDMVTCIMARGGHNYELLSSLFDIQEGKSEIRRKVEQFNSDVKDTWASALKEHGITSGRSIDLPEGTYNECVDMLRDKGRRLLIYLMAQGVKLQKIEAGINNFYDNPYHFGARGLSLLFNLKSQEGEHENE